MAALSLISFMLYSITLFYYASYIYSADKNKTIASIIAGVLINTFLVYISFFEVSKAIKPLSVTLYTLALFFEFRVFYKTTNLSAFFGAISFGTNYLAIQLMTTSVCAYLSDVSIFEYLTSDNLRLFTLAVSTILTIPFLLIVKKIITRDFLDTILDSNKNMMFSSIISLIVFLYASTNAFALYEFSKSDTYLAIYFLLGIRCFLFNLISLIYACLFANLNSHKYEYEQMVEKVEVEEKQLKTLVEKSQLDAFTGVYKRDVVENRIDELIEKKVVFYVSLLDMDGLKIVNDEYGHEEGDFYIKKTAEILKNVFQDDIVGRIGGDEFVAVGIVNDLYIHKNKILQCHKDVKEIQNNFSKPYQTSISYGSILISKADVCTKEEILKEADTRMYAFKKKAKKGRATVKPKEV